jgi:REP-associated tyrosine transposase
MARRPRYEEAGAVQNIYARGVDRCAIFRDDEDRHRYIELLAYVVRRWKWDCLAYCLMTNHIHLLVRTPEPTMGRGMHFLHTFYAQEFNQKYDRVGHLFQSRYGSNRIRTPDRLRSAIEYIAANPVTAGLCESPADWRWSSHARVVAGDAPRWLAGALDLTAIQVELRALS